MPEAILLKDVETLGEKGTVVDVSKGYLRNYLIPRKLAAAATPGALEELDDRPAPMPRTGRSGVIGDPPHSDAIGRLAGGQWGRTR